MIAERRGALRGGWSLLGLGAVAALSVLIGYQADPPLAIRPGAPGLAWPALDGFSSGERDFAWTGARATVRFPEPGPGREGRVELEVSGWRPRGQAPATLAVAAGDRVLSAAPGPAVETVSLPAHTGGVWRSDLTVRLDANPFVPGPGDTRVLGVRVYAVRFVPQPRRGLLVPAPLRPLVMAVGLALVAFALFIRLGRPPRARLVAWLLAVLPGIGFAFARIATAVLLPRLLVLGAAILVLTHAAPGLWSGATEVARGTANALARAVHGLSLARVTILVLGSAVLVTCAYVFRQQFSIDLGSGEEVPLSLGFGAFDRHDGETCREARPGARIDLRGFGSGQWRVEVRAAAAEPQTLRLGQVADTPLEGTLGTGWTTIAATASVPFGWPAGPVIEFSPPRRAGLTVDRVTLDRGRAWPPLQVVALVALAGLLVAVAFAAASGPGREERRASGSSQAATYAGGTLIAVASAGLFADPVATVPFVPWLVLIAGLAALLAATSSAIADRLARRSGSLPIRPSVLAAAAMGFVGWLAATVFPRYRGGHFVFHSSIAEEIWHGRFWLYYLPYPGSMLSRQAQWGNLVIPHPCLYHVLAAPLAALPQPWFYFAEKAGLALLFASMVIAAGVLAGHLAGPEAAGPAAVAAALITTPFQLLGLGHLMTILGCASMTWALTFLVVRWRDLPDRATWLTVVALWALAFLSYFAGLIFLLFVTALIAAAWLWQRRPQARPLLAATIAACLVAFFAYYLQWTGPFLKESLPALTGGTASRPSDGVSLWPRLLAEPGKLQYTFGSFLVPLLGLSGLALLRRSPERLIMAAWAAVLIVFSGVDVYFNFLLKHHYFTITPVAVGCGVVLAWTRQRIGRWAAAAGYLVLAVLGARAALQTALGWIP